MTQPEKRMKNDMQTRFLSQAVQLEEGINPAIVRATMTIISAAIAAFLGWSAVANINEIARTPGEVVPQGYQQVVQHLEGGIVKEIAVHEGDAVDKGDVLLVLDGSGAREDLARAQGLQRSLSLQEERLRAYVEGREADFSAFGGVAADLADQAMFSRGMSEARDQERKVVREQIAQRQHAIETLESELETLRANRAITADLYGRHAKLNKKGYISDVQMLKTRQSLNSIEGEIRQAESRITATQAELAEFQNRLTSLDARLRDDANERLDKLLSEKAQNAELIEKLQDRVARLEVRAPARGLVKGLNVQTVGSVAQPGQTLMEIVPTDEDMIVQVKIPPQHIGHVHPGQRVEVKFSSFDFSRYGVVPGELEHISASTFKGDGGERFYQGRIRLAHGYVGHDARNVVMPGMTVMADIITGEKTVLQYLLKPIHTAMKTAFTER